MSFQLIASNTNWQNNRKIAKNRLVSIDLLRGLVMVLMTLDHTRDFFSNFGFNALDLDRTNIPLFFTRWVTHLCAPSFVFLAGVAAYLSLKKGKNKQQMARFLLIRGLWLIFLELTVVSLAWMLYPGFFMGGVLWAIGWSMIILASIVHLPIRSIAIFGITLIVGHNLFDSIQAEQFGHFSWIWAFLHERTMFDSMPGIYFFLVYPIIPWVGVMATGYAFGTVFTKTKNQRLSWLRNLGCGLILSFVIIRCLNIYGDPQPWTSQSTFLKTILSFINVNKYPPSLAYLLITLGISLLLLYLFESKSIAILNPLIVLGRVPLFFYLLHLWLIHLSAIALALPKYGLAAFTLPYLLSNKMPDDYGYNLHHVYVLWILMLVILYPICNWFDRYKSQHQYWWLKYL
jgi:uncharacterized membrane protein